MITRLKALFWNKSGFVLFSFVTNKEEMGCATANVMKKPLSRINLVLFFSLTNKL